MKLHTYQCDICGAQKKETNRWWMVSRINNLALERAPLVVAEWSDLVAATEDVKHVCGEQHALELVSRFLRTGSLDTQRMPASMPAARQMAEEAMEIAARLSSTSTDEGREP